MKMRFLKNTCFVSLALFGGCLMLWNSAVADPPTTQSTAPQGSTLSLPYHGAASAPPFSVSLFFEESGIFVGEMLCSDTHRNIYIYDRLSSERCAIKKFNAQGKLLQTWPVELRGLGDGVSATVLPDEKVWFNLGIGGFSSSERGGLPIVILQPDQSKPVLDWRQSTPQEVEKAIYKPVNPEAWQAMSPQTKSETRTWVITSLSNIESQVLLKMTNAGEDLPNHAPEIHPNRSQRLSWQILLSGDGQNIEQAQPISAEEAEVSSSFRTSSGVLWHRAVDSPMRPQDWTKLWVWKEGQAKGEPWITRAELLQQREPWQKLIGVQSQQPPELFVDGKDNVYLTWRRKADGPKRQFTVEKESWLHKPIRDNNGERALTVFDSTKKFLTSVPWTTCYYRTYSWIFPVPDGSGFYRSEFGEKAMDIYWHPLPNFKVLAKAPTKVQPPKQ